MGDEKAPSAFVDVGGKAMVVFRSGVVNGKYDVMRKAAAWAKLNASNWHNLCDINAAEKQKILRHFGAPNRCTYLICRTVAAMSGADYDEYVKQGQS
jgi:hypothetical protein